MFNSTLFLVSSIFLRDSFDSHHHMGRVVRETRETLNENDNCGPQQRIQTKASTLPGRGAVHGDRTRRSRIGAGLDLFACSLQSRPQKVSN